MKRIHVGALAALAGLAFAAASLAATPRLVGTDGPGFTITLKKGGVRVRTLPAGRYTLAISDKSSIHNFRLRGPGINRATSVARVGSTTWTVTLRRGTYRYLCDPHALTMRGSFTVK